MVCRRDLRSTGELITGEFVPDEVAGGGRERGGSADEDDEEDEGDAEG